MCVLKKTTLPAPFMFQLCQQTVTMGHDFFISRLDDEMKLDTKKMGDMKGGQGDIQKSSWTWNRCSHG